MRVIILIACGLILESCNCESTSSDKETGGTEDVGGGDAGIPIRNGTGGTDRPEDADNSDSAGLDMNALPDNFGDCGGSNVCEVSLDPFTRDPGAIPHCQKTLIEAKAKIDCTSLGVTTGTCAELFVVQTVYGFTGDNFQCIYDTGSSSLVGAKWSPDNHPTQVAGVRIGADCSPSELPCDECRVASDCTLIPNGCCGTCTSDPDKSDVVAVPIKDADAVRHEQCSEQVDCRQCDIKVVEELALRSELRAVCVSQRCVVVDLREEALSECERDVDCELFLRGDDWLSECGCYTGSPRQWFALRKGEKDPHPYERDPNIACGGCDYTIVRPYAFCAEDKHCAVRETPSVDGERSETCYSPWQALDSAYSPEAQGCDCYGGGPFCRVNSTGNLVALICTDDDLVGYWSHRWVAVEDGPCAD